VLEEHIGAALVDGVTSCASSSAFCCFQPAPFYSLGFSNLINNGLWSSNDFNGMIAISIGYFLCYIWIICRYFLSS
jgi:hypothetical protein